MLGLFFGLIKPSGDDDGSNTRLSGLAATIVIAQILLALQWLHAVVDDHFVACMLHMLALMLPHWQSHKKCVSFPRNLG